MVGVFIFKLPPKMTHSDPDLKFFEKIKKFVEFPSEKKLQIVAC